MTEHYYSSHPNVKSKPRAIRISAKGIERTLWSDAGVFSKEGLDFATYLLLESVDLRDQAVVADLGCGYGPVTAVLSEVYPRASFLMMDVNERAVHLARQNTSEMGQRVRALQSDGFSEADELLFTDIILNPPIRAGKAVVYRLFEESARHLVLDGSLWIVMQKKHGAPSAENKLLTLFEVVDVCYKKSGYYVFRCQSPKQTE
jgi:16S rRNA (guanine1207-N2)-methyltransferase